MNKHRQVNRVRQSRRTHRERRALAIALHFVDAVRVRWHKAGRPRVAVPKIVRKHSRKLRQRLYVA